MEAIADPPVATPINEPSSPKIAEAPPKSPWRRVPCRYGRGCTHITDESHCARFWHPPSLEPKEASLRSLKCYVCNECGFECLDIREMQLHLQRKTAWSNRSLIGCHVSVLLDNRDWQDGIVTQFVKSGRHCVEFKPSEHKRWLNMMKTAFYIVERPPSQTSESKEAYEDTALAPIERWNFFEEVSFEYVRAQSIIHRIYGNKIHETGHRTVGHLCLTEEDRQLAKKHNSSMLYGELLPKGVNRALDSNHLDGRSGSSLYDLGMGTGKVVLQAFLQFPNLKQVYGVELSVSRFQVAEQAVHKLISLSPPGLYDIVLQKRGRELLMRETVTPPNEVPGSGRDEYRFLHLECKNLFEVSNLHSADFVLLETDIPSESLVDLACLLYQMKRGAKVLSYLDFRRLWDPPALPFVQLERNRSLADRFPTSWSVQRGHHFFVWVKTCGPILDAARFYAFRKDTPDAPQGRTQVTRAQTSKQRAEESTDGSPAKPPTSRSRRAPPTLSLPARHRRTASWSLLSACTGLFRSTRTPERPAAAAVPSPLSEDIWISASPRAPQSPPHPQQQAVKPKEPYERKSSPTPILPAVKQGPSSPANTSNRPSGVPIQTFTPRSGARERGPPPRSGLSSRVEPVEPPIDGSQAAAQFSIPDRSHPTRRSSCPVM